MLGLFGFMMAVTAMALLVLSLKAGLAEPVQPPFGYEGKVYRGAPGATAVTEMDNVIDVLFTEATEKKQNTKRNNGQMHSYRTGLTDVTVEIVMHWLSGDPHFDALRQAYLDNDAIAIAVQPGGVDSAAGIDGDFLVEHFDGPQRLGELTVATIRLCPTDAYGRNVTPN